MDENTKVTEQTAEVAEAPAEPTTPPPAPQEEKKDKKKIVAIILLLLAILFAIWWFFLRMIPITLDYNVKGKEDEIVKVRIRKTLKEDEIAGKEELGDRFIAWFEVVDVDEDGKEILAKKPYDFETKIKAKKKLNAVYEGKKAPEPVPVPEAKTITISFDSKGGSKVNSIVLTLGDPLNLPKNPTKKDCTFKGWKSPAGKQVKNGVVFDKDTRLTAEWEEVTKAPEPKQEAPTEAPKGPETIVLSVDHKILHRNGTYQTAQVTAKTTNPSGPVTFSIDSARATIDAKTGLIKLKTVTPKNIAIEGCTMTITGTLPSGKSATITVAIETDLELTAGSSQTKILANTTDKNAYNESSQFTITANQNVTWKPITPASETHSNWRYDYFYNVSTNTPTTWSGSAYHTRTNINDGSTLPTVSVRPQVTATTPGGQSITVTENIHVN